MILKNFLLTAGILFLLSGCVESAPAATITVPVTPARTSTLIRKDASDGSPTTPWIADTPALTHTPSRTKKSTATAAATATVEPPRVISELHAPALPDGAIARLGKGTMHDVAVSPVAQAAAAATATGVYTYRLGADGYTLEEAWFGPTTTPMHSVAFSPDGKILASGSEGWYNDSSCDPGQLNRPSGILTLWDAQSGEVIRDWKVTGCFIKQLEFTEDGRNILYRAFCFMGEYVALVNVETGGSVDFLPEGDLESASVSAMAVSQDGSRIAAGYDLVEFLPGENHKYTAMVYDNASQNPPFRLDGFDARVTDLAFSPDNSLIAVGLENGLVSLHEFPSGGKKSILPSPGTGVTQIRFSPGGKILAVSHGDGMIRLWDTLDESLIRVMNGKGANVLAFSSEEPTLLSAGAKAPLIEWELGNGTARHVYPFAEKFSVSGLGRSLDISPDGKYLAAGGLGGKITLFDTATFLPLRTFEIKATYGTMVSFSPDGKTLAGSADGTIRFWNYRTGNAVLSLEGNTPVFSPDGRTIAYAVTTKDHQNEKVEIFDRAAGKTLFSLPSLSPFESAFTPDGTALAYSVPEGIALWSLTEKKELKRWEVGNFGGVQIASVPGRKAFAIANLYHELAFLGIDGENPVPFPNLQTYYSLTKFVNFTPDGTLGVFISGITAIWTVVDGKQIAGMAGHTCHGTSADFTPDGRIVATSAYDDTVLVWDLEKMKEFYP
jgi:WD40 repeat protein